MYAVLRASQKMSLRDILLNEDSFSCSWIAENKNICDSVTWSRNCSSGLEAVSVDTCVLLNQGSCPQDRPSEIRFVLRPNFRATQITVVSDARIVEVYGTCGEYVGTESAAFIDEFEDMAVYMAEVALPQPLSECAVKFAGLKASHQMWLYGIHLTVEETASAAPPKRLIDFRNVNQMIERSGCKLSEKAEKCQNFLESFASSANLPAPVEVTGLLKTMEERCSTNGDVRLSSPHRLVDLFDRFSTCPGLMNGGLVAPRDTGCQEGTCEPVGDRGDPGTPSSALCYLGDYIDRRFAQSEKLLLARIDEKFRELETKQNEKLDLILQQLKVLNTHT